MFVYIYIYIYISILVLVNFVHQIKLAFLYYVFFSVKAYLISSNHLFNDFTFS